MAAARVRGDEEPHSCGSGYAGANVWLAQGPEMGKPASVNQYVRRHRLGGRSALAGFRRVRSRVKS